MSKLSTMSLTHLRGMFLLLATATGFATFNTTFATIAAVVSIISLTIFTVTQFGREYAQYDTGSHLNAGAITMAIISNFTLIGTLLVTPLTPALAFITSVIVNAIYLILPNSRLFVKKFPGHN